MNKMKCSVSMTSLESPQKSLRTPESHQRKPWPAGRQCCSLNSKKPRRALDKKMWRRSWGSNNDDSSQEELWRMYQQPVQELVEANSDEQGLRHFLENYTNACAWLNSMQIERERIVDALKLSKLADNMTQRQSWRVEVNQSAKALSQKYPNLKEEFQWRLKHLNSQWDALDTILSRHRNSGLDSENHVTANKEGKDCDLDWVRDWLREKENELQPLNFRTQWSEQLLDQEICRYKAIQAEIEEKASSIHGVLRQCQSRGRSSSTGNHITAGNRSESGNNSKENSKRSRLETRWLQLRLRVLEWVQHLSGVAERQRNLLKKGRRSDIYYTASNWESDGDNEPLRKCPKFDDDSDCQLDEQADFNNTLAQTCFNDENFISSVDLSNILQEDGNPLVQRQQEQNEEQFHLVSKSYSLHTIPFTEEHCNQQEESGNKNGSTISNHGQLTQQVVPSSPSSCFVSKHDQVFLQRRQRKGSREQRECQHLVGVTLNEVDCDMGQSQNDSENVFSHSEPQFPNSVVGFTLEASQCVGMKRKLSSPSASPPLSPTSEAQEFQQVVPRNISIYYFKHSDTEQEPNSQQRHGDKCSHSQTPSSGRSPQQKRRASRAHCENSASNRANPCSDTSSKLANCTFAATARGGNCSGGFGDSESNSGRGNRHQFCQKSRLFLDLDQEFEDDITSLKSYDEISFGSFDLDLEEDLEEDEAVTTPPEATVISEASRESLEQVGVVHTDTLNNHQNYQVNQTEEQYDHHYSMMDLEGNFCSTDNALLRSSEQRERNHSFNLSNNKGSISPTASVNNIDGCNKPVARLGEIEELVQKAELLVQQTARSRVVDCVDLPLGVGSSEDDDDEDDETLMLPQKHSGDNHVHHYHHHHHHNHHHHHHRQQHQNVMIAPTLTNTIADVCNTRCCGLGSSSGNVTIAAGEITRGNTTTANNNGNGHENQELLHSSSLSVRKCSVSSCVSSSSVSTATVAHRKLVKSIKSISSSLSSWSISGDAATDGQVSCRSSVRRNQNHNISTNKNTMSNVNNSRGMPIVVGAASIATPSHSNLSCCINNNPNQSSTTGIGESGATLAASNVISGGTGVNSNCLGATAQNSSSTSLHGKSKKSSRVRQWIRAHNSEIVVNQKSTSSCDASAESASDSECSSSGSEHPVSSDDPSTSTFLHQTHAALLESSAKALSTCSSSNNIFGSGTLGFCGVSPSTIKSHRSPLASTSDVANQSVLPSLAGISPGASGTVPLRSKKRLTYGKQRPKSFTDTTTEVSAKISGPSAGSPGRTWLRTSPSYFVSDSAINLLGNRSPNSSSEGSGSSSSGDCACSPGNNVDSPSHPKKKASSRFKKRSQKGKRKPLQNELDAAASTVGDNAIKGSRILRSSSFTESASGPRKERKGQPSDGADQSSVTDSSPKPNFLISGPLSSHHQSFTRLSSDKGSMNTDELNNDQQADWDSYQEKYLSEPYSEEPYDPDGTLKLLAFGEDYGQYLDRADSESSSMLSGFNPADSRKRRPLTLANRGEMADSDSDREELNYLLRQSNSQLRFISNLFRDLLVKAENNGEAPGKYAEMEATCDENIGSLKLVLTNIDETENLPFEIDVRSIEDVLEKWHILREKIRQAANIHHIKEEMGDLKMDFSNVHSLFCTCKQFDITDMDSLRAKIRSIEDVLTELPSRKLQLQQLNDASLKTQVFLDDQDAVGIIKQQMNELYALYEDNLQLGTFLLEKMRYLQDAWEQFEKEKQEFEKSVNVSNLRTKLRKEFSSSASTDSGHGTDFSHDSSISDSDEYQEGHKKLVALKERAKKVKAFLPPGSPVLGLLDQSVEEAEKGLSSLKQTAASPEVLDLKSLYPRKKPFAYTRRSSGQKSPKSKLHLPVPKRVGRKWTVVRRMVMFNMALMGMFLAAAYFLHPKCCEFTNTFCFSLVPHLTHESLPPI